MDSTTNGPQAVADAAAEAKATMSDGQSVADMKDMKLVVMDSAELATRAAGLAAQAGLDLRTATKDLTQGNQAMMSGYQKQGKFSMILV
ncbi:MAG: hypothetical protein ACKO3Q_00130, partial [Betaproteobacteria bacterium]